MKTIKGFVLVDGQIITIRVPNTGEYVIKGTLISQQLPDDYNKLMVSTSDGDIDTSISCEHGTSTYIYLPLGVINVKNQVVIECFNNIRFFGELLLKEEI